MVECVRTQVNEWLERGLEEYYPVVFVDCVHIKIHRKRSVAVEALYVALAVTGEGTREVPGIFNMPQESATGRGEILDRLKDRGLQRIGLMVADGIKGLDTVIGEKIPGTPLQRCVTHLKRNMFAKVRHGDKAALAADLRDISTVSSFGAAMFLAGCSSAEPVSSSDGIPKLINSRQTEKI